jgi:hypothetical protein
MIRQYENGICTVVPYLTGQCERIHPHLCNTKAATIVVLHPVPQLPQQRQSFLVFACTITKGTIATLMWTERSSGMQSARCNKGDRTGHLASWHQMRRQHFHALAIEQHFEWTSC